MEDSGHALQVLSRHLSVETEENHKKLRIAGLQAEILYHDHPEETSYIFVIQCNAFVYHVYNRLAAERASKCSQKGFLRR
jgi:hypothetical protein